MINFRLIRHLWLFLAVAEDQNFSRAAKRLGMSQPPLTEQIQALEQSLRIQLFTRSRRGAQLTAAGAAILPAVRKFADQLERLELAVHEAVAGHAGVVTIGAITSAMIDVLPQLIERFKQDHPLVTVSVREIDSAEAIPALEAGDIDIAFARLEGNLGRHLQSMPLSEDRLAVAMPKDHPLASSAAIELKALADETLVMASRDVSPVYFDYLVGLCKASGFAPRIVHQVRSVTAQVAFVSCGQGIALVPTSMDKLAPENVLVRPLQPEVKVVTTAMAWHGVNGNPLVDAMIDQAKQVFAS
ncbi:MULTISPECIES: LysR family transcriptional regulator [Pseudomonas]|uniref:LysR family transcriptional regulator n=1 Tax=Pseudomonas putida NBRC 14164 TaxID=1211579 RepID=A0ABM7EFC5_PSEPU|nr:MULTISPECIES: LysR family transcriptional regulator [Pseudomonas]EKT4460212.1 LysR family transcriptional regulator [Pseudomonas putida]EKT4555753.1 LysR family transcriptional regulator [Pseudomonas putida]MCX9136960.1 LysR substrate-binding domain-containing protein [Pseudomonas sp. DCB_PUT]MDD1970714.1 LysR substrate-binding domain-containing protein [Pseudomonas putida]MDO1464584.1 LysR family transcriptional regulator [Pseudomonas putida]